MKFFPFGSLAILKAKGKNSYRICSLPIKNIMHKNTHDAVSNLGDNVNIQFNDLEIVEILESTSSIPWVFLVSHNAYVVASKNELTLL